MYSVDGYGRMLIDDIRTSAYIRALEHTIKPGSVVVDIGTGPGFFALLACKLGARRVYAIEPDNVIQLAIECARQAGVSDRVEFIQNLSTKVDLPEPADVIVADLRGVLPFFGTNLPSLKDAKNRLLSSDGILIPARDHLFAALAEAPTKYEKLEAPWGNREGVSLSPVKKVVKNNWSKARLEESDLLSNSVCWHTIDYSHLTAFGAQAEITFAPTSSGIAHGIVVWFESELCEGVTFSNAPDQPELIYGNAFFPLMEPVEITPDVKVSLRIRVDLINEEYLWSWETLIEDSQTPDTPPVHFKQSTLLGVPLSQAHLKTRANTYVPIPNEEAIVTSFILSRMDGNRSNEELAKIVAREFPAQFPTVSDALDAVAAVSAKYSR